MSRSRDYLGSLEQFGIKLGLEQIRQLVEQLGRPDQAFQSVIIAGTNGKGSVTAMVERALRAAGYRTGRYTSPHLVRLEERFVVNGEELGSADVDEALEAVRLAAGSFRFPPTFFEATTAAAFELFRRHHVEIAVLEVGLGGRLDATNVVTPAGAIITAIDFDHEQHLGRSLEAIAGEKAGVIKPERLIVLGRNATPVQTVVRKTATAIGAPVTYAPDGVTVETVVREGRTTATIATPRGRYDDVRLALRGQHQVDNAVTAVRFLEEIDRATEIRVRADAIRTGLEEAVWPARLELSTWRGAELLIDGAHNPSGARALAAYVRAVYGRPLPMVIAVMRDKAIDALILALADAASQFVFTAAESPRAASPADLLAAATRVAPQVPATEMLPGLTALEGLLQTRGPIVIAGSLYFCGEIKRGIS